MIEKITLKIVSPVVIGGRLPGQVFRVAAVDGVPAELYWRSRIADGSAVVEAAPTPQAAKAAKQKD